MSRRVIRKTARYCDLQVTDLLQSLFAAELMSPSEVLWLVSAWVSDLPIIDNRDASFTDFDPSWTNRPLRLSEVLGSLAERGSRVVVVTNTDPHNEGFLHRLETLTAERGISDLISTDQQDDLHVKGLLGDEFHLHGSMNLTHNGVRVLAEEVVLELNTDHVQRAHLEYRDKYGPT